MSTASRHSGFRFTVILWASVAGALLLHHPPCGANVAPESALLVHVQPVSGSCQTPLTDCEQIIRSTHADGPLEFLLFFMRGSYAWPGEEICLESLESVLTWPRAWELLEFDPCAGSGSLSSWSPGGVLQMQWYGGYHASDEPGGIVPVARLVVNVVGPGQLGVEGNSGIVLRHDCYGSTFVSYPAQVGAEAGMQCGYVSPHCGYFENGCLARFELPELSLIAPFGGVAEGTAGFYSEDQVALAFCPLTVETHASWCSAWIEHEGTYNYDAHLHVTADASGLEPGTYETALELVNSYQGASRCLPVEFTVDAPSSASRVSWGRVKSMYR